HEDRRRGERDRQEGVHGEAGVERAVPSRDDRNPGRPATHQVPKQGDVDRGGGGFARHSSRHLNRRMASRKTTTEPMRTTSRSKSAREVFENSITWFIPSIT